ncbi:MAG: MOSC domain-containing protein [Phycisphaerae bacterium]|nr:MOSC domain-containing protein [Phycisphaerae bacterium]
MRIFSLNIGQPRLNPGPRGPYRSAINRRPVPGPVGVGSAGLEGDRPADLRHHGGPEMAVCCYPHEHYRPMATFLASPLAIPAFGENFTTEGLLETVACIGDVLAIGSALLQISKPREPCATLARKHDRPDLVRRILESGHCGFYLRVLEAGEVRRGDTITLRDRPHPSATVASTLAAMTDGNASRDLLERMAGLDHLSPPWQTRLHKRLEQRR